MEGTQERAAENDPTTRTDGWTISCEYRITKLVHKLNLQ